MRILMNRVTSLLFALIIMAGAAWAESGAWRVVEKAGVVRTSANMAGVQLVSTGEMLGSGAVLSTGSDGRVVLARGDQQIVVGPNSRMSLPAVEQKGMTRIVQDLGTLLFKVDKREKQHFRVETPIIAAVVKGTTFTVTAGASGHSVHVAEGAVEVSALRGGAREMVTAGQTARVSNNNPAVIRMSNNNSEEASFEVPGDEAVDVETDDSSDNGKRANNMVVPAAIGEGALDFNGLTNGLVQASANASSNAFGAARQGNGVASFDRGVSPGAAVAQDARANGPVNNGRASTIAAANANLGVAAGENGLAFGLNGGTGNGNSGSNNAGGNSNGNAGGVNAGVGNGNGNTGGVNAGLGGGNGNGNSGGNNAGGNGNGLALGLNGGVGNGNGNGNGNGGVDVDFGLGLGGGNGNGNSGGNNAGGNGNGLALGLNGGVGNGNGNGNGNK